MQVDWSKAPEWAEWHAFNKDGYGCWYESEPYRFDGLGYFSSFRRIKRSRYFSLAAEKIWKRSLAKRPKETKGEDMNMSSFLVNWSSAPEWAMYHAFSKNGDGYWYESEPEAMFSTWGDHDKSLKRKASGFFVKGGRWDLSLTERPAQTTTTHDTTQQILSERGSRYGKFSDLSSIDQALKHVMHQAPNWDSLKPHHKTALEMIQHKISRILNGDPDYDDNWIDIEGYSRLGRKPNQ